MNWCGQLEKQCCECLRTVLRYSRGAMAGGIVETYAAQSNVSTSHFAKRARCRCEKLRCHYEQYVRVCRVRQPRVSFTRYVRRLAQPICSIRWSWLTIQMALCGNRSRQFVVSMSGSRPEKVDDSPVWILKNHPTISVQRTEIVEAFLDCARTSHSHVERSGLGVDVRSRGRGSFLEKDPLPVCSGIS